MSRWPVVPLGEICLINPRLMPDERPEGDLPVTFVPMAAVDEEDGKIGELQVRPYREVSKGYTAFRSGDVLFAKITPCMENGKAAIANRLANNLGFGSTEFHVLRPSEQVVADYVFYFIRRREFRLLAKTHFTGTAGQQRVPVAFMQQARIPLPHLDEQRRIVDILNRANGIRRLRREALAKARQLIPALFVEMFGDPLDYQRQWPKKALGDLVAAFEGGKNLQAGSEHGGDATFRILKVSAVTWGDFRPEESKPAPEDHAPPKHHFVRDGDLLFSRANTEELVGATVLVRNPPANLLLPDKLWRVVWRQSSEVISQYALAYFQHPSIRRAMGNLATGTSASMRNISQAKLRTLQMPVPPLSLQRAFAARVADIQSIIDEQVRAAAAADQLVASLMARFFEG